EYGATMGYFPVDEKTCDYLAATGRSPEHVQAVRSYFQAQGMFGIPRAGQCRYSQVLELNLAEITSSVAGPKRPQDRIELPRLKEKFMELLGKPITENGYNKRPDDIFKRYPTAMGANGETGGREVAGGGDQSTESVPPITRDRTTAKNTNAWTESEMINNRPTPDRVCEEAEEHSASSVDIGNGDVLIAAITSCTNTSNPSVMLAAGLVAKKASDRGL